MIISIDFDKSFWQNSTSIYDKKKKILQKVDIEGIYLNTIRAVYNKLTANIILKSEILKTFPLRSGTKQGCSFSPLLFSLISKGLATAIRDEKE